MLFNELNWQINCELVLFRNKSGVLASFSFSIVLLTVEHILSIGEDHEMWLKSERKKKEKNFLLCVCIHF